MFWMEKLKRWSSIFLLPVMLTVPMQVLSANRTVMSEEQVLQIAEEIGGKYNICPEFLTAIAFRESRYNPNAEYDGCSGLMQVSPKWHVDRMERLDVSDLRDPYGNMLVASDYLLELFEQYGDPGMVLQVYNGDSNADEYWIGDSGMSEYATNIIKMSEELERKYENKGEQNYVR